MKTKPTLKESLEGWLVFDGHWFWEPDSGVAGAVLTAAIIVTALLIFWP